MKALVITQSYLPHLGGVEKHIAGTLPYLIKSGLEIDIISVRDLLRGKKSIKFLGLIQIWWEIAKKIQLVRQAQIVFIHDVFIYYLPFIIFFPKKKVITTFHGWEKIFPIPAKNIFYKKIAQKFSSKTISIGQYINKYYGLKSKNNYLSYGAVDLPQEKIDLTKKEKNSFLFIGRLEEDTGLSIFLDFLDILSAKKINFSVKFCGDGPMRNQCQKYGLVLGFGEVANYLKTSTACFAGGYLSILEAMAYKNIPLAAYQNELKKDYYLESPFSQAIACANSGQNLYENYLTLQKQVDLLEKNYRLSQEYSFEKLANLYLELSR